MRRNKFKEFVFGYKYIANERTKEIHIINTLKSSCKVHFMTKAVYLTKKAAANLLKNGFNGCRFCYPEEDKG